MAAVKQLPRDERRASIVTAARDILFAEGFDAVTMPAIAQRLGVSRQILYLHFHGVDEVLDALFGDAFYEYFGELVSTSDVTRRTSAIALQRLDQILNLPLHAHRVVASSFFTDPSRHSAASGMRRRIFQIMDEGWISPLVNSGMDPVTTRVSVITVFAATLALRDQIEAGDITRSDAARHLRRLVRTIVPTPTHDNAATDTVAAPTDYGVA